MAYNLVWLSPFTVHLKLSQLISYYCLVAKSCPALCAAIYCSPQVFSVHGISQARILQ